MSRKPQATNAIAYVDGAGTSESIEMLLFTKPGEGMLRPKFGGGVRDPRR